MIQFGEEVLSLRRPVLEESARCVERWSKHTQLLEGIGDEYLRGCIALLLENQRLILESTSEGGQQGGLFYPVVRDVYLNSLFTKIASLQPMLGPTGHAYYREGAIPLTAKTRRIFGVFPAAPEADADKTAATVKADFDWETYSDLWNTCESTERCPADLFLSQIPVVWKRVAEKNGGRAPNWLVTTADVAACPEVLGFCPERTYVLEVGPAGADRRRADAGKKGVVIGYKGEEYMDAGYCVAPYVPLTLTPVMLDPELFAPKRGLLTRYDKRLVPGGANYYGKVVIEE